MAGNLLTTLDDYTYQYIYRHVFDNILRELVSETFLSLSWEDHKKIYSKSHGLSRADRFGLTPDSSKLIEDDDPEEYPFDFEDDEDDDVEDNSDTDSEFEEVEDVDVDVDVEDNSDTDSEFEEVEDEVGPIPPYTSSPDVFNNI